MIESIGGRLPSTKAIKLEIAACQGLVNSSYSIPYFSSTKALSGFFKKALLVGTPSEEVKNLMDVTKEAMYIGIEKAVLGNRIGDIGAAIQEYAESRGYGVVRDLVGHGVGPTMHEEPMVPNYGIAGRGLRLREGMVLTIEPMINTGDWEIDTDMKTGWAHKTIDGGLSCQYEHQFVITKDGPVILTSQGEEGTY